MLENEEGGFEEEAYLNSCYFQDQDNHLYQGKPSWCLLLQYLSLSIMHVLLPKFYKNWLNETIFDVAITTLIIIRIIIMLIVETWYYQAHSHHMVYLPSNVNEYEVPKWTP